MSNKFKVGDLVRLIRSYHPIIPERYYIVTYVCVEDSPFMYKIKDTTHIFDGYPEMHITGDGYRLLTKAERILYVK